MIHTTEASEAMLVQASLEAARRTFVECGQHGAADMTRHYLRVLITNGVVYHGPEGEETAIISPEIRHANRQLAERALRLRTAQ